MSRNYGNGWVPHVGRYDGHSACSRCGTEIAWIRTARRRLPFEREFGTYLTDHRDHCRILVRQLNQTASQISLGSAWGVLEAQEGPTAGPSRDESAAHVRATQAGGQTTRRAVAHATPPPSNPRAN
jgi:hypothetical protein